MNQIYAHSGNHRVRWAPLTVVAAAIVIGGIVATVALTTSSKSSSTGGIEPAGLFDSTNPLADASTTCNAGTLADDDHTLVVDMAGEESGTGTATIDDIVCVLGELETPQAVVAQMESTRALDGMQSTTWSTYKATWTYHPDDGLDLIITHTN
jgi:hypothetical protein